MTKEWMNSNIPMADVHFDSSILRWYHQPTVIQVVIPVRATKCPILMVYMIWKMWVPYWNTTISTVDNLCWCLFNKPHSTYKPTRGTHTKPNTRSLLRSIKNQMRLTESLFHFSSDKYILMTLLTFIFSPIYDTNAVLFLRI